MTLNLVLVTSGTFVTCSPAQLVAVDDCVLVRQVLQKKAIFSSFNDLKVHFEFCICMQSDKRSVRTGVRVCRHCG